MKKIFAIVTACVLVFAFTACENTSNETENSSLSESITSGTQDTESSREIEEDSSLVDTSEAISEPETSQPVESDTTELIVYFSWSGNTKSVADEIQNQTGADMFSLIPVEPYTDDYNTLLDIAQEEKNSNARPEILGSIENFEDYEVIYLGYPIWWGDMPMIVYSFLDDYDLSGKTIVPFITSGGSGFSDTMSAIESMEPEAEVLKGLSLGSSQASDPESAVTEWLSDIGLAE